jgi:hypothetical protein
MLIEAPETTGGKSTKSAYDSDQVHGELYATVCKQDNSGLLGGS